MSWVVSKTLAQAVTVFAEALAAPVAVTAAGPRPRTITVPADGWGLVHRHRFASQRGILLPPAQWRVAVTVVAVLMSLAAPGVISARIGGSNPRRAVARLVIGGAAGLALTYGIGHLFGAAIS